jgi:hypothetical protein
MSVSGSNNCTFLKNHGPEIFIKVQCQAQEIFKKLERSYIQITVNELNSFQLKITVPLGTGALILLRSGVLEDIRVCGKVEHLTAWYETNPCPDARPRSNASGVFCQCRYQTSGWSWKSERQR